MAVISASYKTDIPAFYGDWFQQQLTQKFVEIKNPYNNKKSIISLAPEDVDAFVFWTRNAAPFLPVLYKYIADSHPFYFQFTLTAYPRLIETSVISSENAISQMISIAKAFGPHGVVCRYDPIFISDLTPLSFHLENFTNLVRQLEATVSEVVVSFTQRYAKTKRNLARLEQKTPLNFQDPPDEIKQLFWRNCRKLRPRRE